MFCRNHKRFFTITNREKAVADHIPGRAGNRLKTAINNILQVKKHKTSDKELKELKERRGRR